MGKITIPATIEEATESLNGIDSLLTAKGWERAAVVYAFTEPHQGARTDLARKGAKFTMAEFAELGISGLRKRDTVAHYRQAWIDGKGDLTIKPGDTVTLPKGKFPPGRTGTDGFNSEEGLDKSIAKAVKIHGSEKVAEVVLKEIGPAVTSVLAEAETKAAVEAVAKAKGIAPEAVSKDEAESVRYIARSRAERRGSTTTEEASGAADFVEKTKKAAKRIKDERLARTDFRAIEVMGEFNKAYRLLSAVMPTIRDAAWDDDHIDLILEDLTKIKSVIALIEVALDGSADIDWDAELAALAETETEKED